MKAGYGGDFIDEVVNVGTMDAETLGALFERRGPTRSRRSSASRSIGAGGVYPARAALLGRRSQRLCREHDILLIADEVITGFGRTGKLWGSQRYGIEPDLITFAKGVTSGYQPLGGVLVGRRVRAPFWDEDVPGADVPPRLHLLGPRRRGRRGDGQPRHPRGRGAGRAGRRRWSRCWMPRSGGSRRRRASARSGPSGLTAAVAVPAGPAGGRSGPAGADGGRGPEPRSRRRASSAATPSRSPRRS